VRYIEIVLALIPWTVDRESWMITLRFWMVRFDAAIVKLLIRVWMSPPSRSDVGSKMGLVRLGGEVCRPIQPFGSDDLV